MVQRQVVIDHVGLVVSDLAASDRFYTEALKSLGFKRLGENDVDGAVAYGLEGLDDFAIKPARDAPATTSTHVAFVAESREAVDTFYAAALAAGGTERAAPRVREEYSPRYYAAYVNDPDGNNVEAVHHG